MKKKKGSAQIVLLVGGLALFFVSLISITVLSLKKGNIDSQKIENVVKQATLGAAIYDTNQYGTDHSIVITDVNKSYNEFLNSLKESMYLDDNMNSLNKSFTKGKIKVKNFIIYNVKGNDIEVITKGDMGESKILYKNQKGIMKTPKNVIVDKTIIYSKIGFKISIMGEDFEDAEKDATVAVVQN